MTFGNRHRVEGASRSRLAEKLEQTARLCEENVRLHVERGRDRDGTDVISALMLVAAALTTAARAVEDDAARDTALLITATLAADAIDAAERRGFDESLLHCVSELRGIAVLCEAAVRH